MLAIAHVLPPTARPFCAAGPARSARRRPQLQRSHLQRCRAEQPEREGEGKGASPPPPAAPGADPPTPIKEELSLQLPRDVIERMRTTVFSFDTFFVTVRACGTWQV